MPCLLRLCTPWGVVALSERYRGESQTFSALFQPQWNTAQPTTSFHPGRTGSPSSLLQDHRFPKNVSLQTLTSKRWVTFYFILIDLSRTWDFQRGKRGRKNPTGLSGDSYSHSKGNCSKVCRDPSAQTSNLSQAPVYSSFLSFPACLPSLTE